MQDEILMLGGGYKNSAQESPSGKNKDWGFVLLNFNIGLSLES